MGGAVSNVHVDQICMAVFGVLFLCTKRTNVLLCNCYMSDESITT